MKLILTLSAYIQIHFLAISQCETFLFNEIGSSEAYCRTSSIQSGNGVVYASATGGLPAYAYLWTDLQTGATNTNTTWGGKNPGLYKIQVTDQIGCVLIDTVEVDSINPLASFSITSSDLDGSMVGSAPVDAQFLNTSTGVAWIGGMGDDPIYWKLGNDASYSAWWDVYEPISATFSSESDQEICLAIENSNGCKDTSCQTITILGFAAVEESNYSRPLTVFPNPCTETQQLSIFTLEKTNAHIQLMNSAGIIIREIYRGDIETNTSFNVGLSELPAGIYFYKISLGNGSVYYQQILKN